MNKFNVGDRISIKSSGRTGIVRAIFESGYWHMADDEYSIILDDGSGAITVPALELELISAADVPKCECGLKYSRSGGRHSFWCILYDEND